MQKHYNAMRTCDELLLEFKNLKNKDDLSLIKFTGVDNQKDVYNITAPFEFEGGMYIAGRVEERDSECSNVVFFRKSEAEWKADDTIESLPLQDPFISQMDGQYIIGGVEIFDDEENPGQLNYRTIFYRGSSLRNLERFAEGPDRMKDIRFCQLKDKKILVMTRPQGKIGGRGKIGYLIIDTLEELTPERIMEAAVLEGQFAPEEWGGCNELHLLEDGKVGVLSHIAKYDESGNRHYYATAFCLDSENGDYTPMKMIAVRANFQDGPSKRPDLKDVIFSGGLIRQGNGRAELYCGVSDVQGHKITIEDPFESFQLKRI